MCRCSCSSPYPPYVDAGISSVGACQTRWTSPGSELFLGFEVLQASFAAVVPACERLGPSVEGVARDGVVHHGLVRRSDVLLRPDCVRLKRVMNRSLPTLERVAVTVEVPRQNGSDLPTTTKKPQICFVQLSKLPGESIPCCRRRQWSVSPLPG